MAAHAGQHFLGSRIYDNLAVGHLTEWVQVRLVAALAKFDGVLDEQVLVLDM